MRRISRFFRIPVILSVAVALSGFYSCNSNGAATINFHQVGSCNGWKDGSTLHAAGPNAAYIIFRVDSIDNSQGKVDFSFDPSKMSVDVSTHPHMDPTISLAQFIGVSVLVPINIPQGQTMGLNGYSVTIVPTSDPNGAAEANQTTYILNYDKGSADPAVVFVPDKTWTPLSQPTLDCTTITYQ